MAEAAGSSSPQNGTDSAAADDKPRLTEEEKKQNHIASEQKRREAIRAGFDRLCDIVPGLEGQGRSEGLVLKKTVDYMREQMEVRRQLIRDKEARGEYVPDEMREPVLILERIEAREARESAMRTEEDGDS
ncbi:uncharacterized protein B0I36DRAFT_350947 [Microdochium trichocladiopsis]|uniref:BHLH domain-containing protein n=1 Tax=Microdochium trichocladiopsis TaxID=1682393 RepID=A0A9P9BN67_9PEZI|nr:uncharacterized protein B0I36DRAFT_350947 [Microdochium trichocladiopsis]KAH7027413.1 hypothetical protein B0I36DRAFT_350947 [Microdochium trichocladiopsis]